MTVAIVQSNYHKQNASATDIVALPAAATAGNAVILCVGYQDTSHPVHLAAPIDAGGGTYNIGFQPDDNGHESKIAVWYIPNCTADIHNTTLNGDANLWSVMAIYEVSGLIASPLDKVSAGGITDFAPANSYFSQATGTTGTLSQATEWALVVCSADDNFGMVNEGIMVPAGYTVDPNIPIGYQNTNNNVVLQVGWKEISSTAALNPSFTWGTTGNLTSTYAAIMTFKEVIAGPGDTLMGQAWM